MKITTSLDVGLESALSGGADGDRLERRLGRTGSGGSG